MAIELTEEDELKVTSTYASRKFIITILLIIIATAALYLKIATFSEFSTYSILIFSAYGTANFGDKYLDGQINKQNAVDNKLTP